MCPQVTLEVLPVAGTSFPLDCGLQGQPGGDPIRDLRAHSARMAVSLWREGGRTAVVSGCSAHHVGSQPGEDVEAAAGAPPPCLVLGHLFAPPLALRCGLSRLSGSPRSGSRTWVRTPLHTLAPLLTQGPFRPFPPAPARLPAPHLEPSRPCPWLSISALAGSHTQSACL